MRNCMFSAIEARRAVDAAKLLLKVENAVKEDLAKIGNLILNEATAGGEVIDLNKGQYPSYIAKRADDYLGKVEPGEIELFTKKTSLFYAGLKSAGYLYGFDRKNNVLTISWDI